MVGFKVAGTLLLNALKSNRVINAIGDMITGWTRNKVDDNIWELKKALDSGEPVKIEEALINLGYAVRVEWLGEIPDKKEAP